MSFLQICTKLLNYSRSYTSTREDSIVTVNLLEINYVDLLLINFSPNETFAIIMFYTSTVL